MGIPSIPGDFPFSPKVICCVSFLFSSFVILAFVGFNSFSVFWDLFVFWCKGRRKSYCSNLGFESH